MGKGSGNGTTRGDRKRNVRRERLRGLLPRDGAVIGIDLAEDKQALAVIDHDVRVLARKTVKVKAFRLGEALDWAVAQARLKGFAHVAVACEQPPAGAAYLDRSDIRPGMAYPDGVLVSAFSSIGWGWGGNWAGSPDYQHSRSTAGSGRRGPPRPRARAAMDSSGNLPRWR